MAPLSRALSGFILSHDHFGSHLDGSGRTVDLELEKQNFLNAGETLAAIWSEMAIDGYNVDTEFMPCDEVLPPPLPVPNHQWYADLVGESQYLLQIIKCNDVRCCSPLRSNLKHIIHENFLPAPFSIIQDPFSVPPPTDHHTGRFSCLLVRQSLTLRPSYTRTKKLPYHHYCPSLQQEISGRTCSQCGIYFASKVSLDQHKKNLHGIEPLASCVRPLRVHGRRQDEALCTISEDVIEWIDVQSIDDSIQLEEIVN
ncbi:hypothetical protein QAD02_002176 [Eretmocerus hayati]|uniref:Uncharacterized protein n=1 Tax=Eretmocerus hayati TaxID=131215 RepID=A0ACC2NL22_9HYME|nr:hypothetical protein QAD02_002176 [Eretmocerus hayati]